MKQTWTMRIWKADRRVKGGQRLISVTEWADRDEDSIKRECVELFGQYPASKGYRFEYKPTYCVVKNLMTGAPVTIRAEDRGGPCDPSMERYWSM